MFWKNLLFIVAVLPFVSVYVFAGQGGGPQGAGSSSGPGFWPEKAAEGDEAPDFTLKSPDGKTSFTLSAFKNKKPVVLVFGSYT